MSDDDKVRGIPSVQGSGIKVIDPFKMFRMLYAVKLEQLQMLLAAKVVWDFFY